MQHSICTRLHPPHLNKAPGSDPYQLLSDCFDDMSIDEHHRCADSFVQAACTNAYVRENPGTLLTWYEKTIALFYIAHLIFNSNYPKETDIGVDVSHLPWNQQPHHLADYELKDPYITIEDCFELMPYDHWLSDLHRWLHAALGEHAVWEEGNRITETITLLHKLPDALWMLHLQARQQQPKSPHPATPTQRGQESDS